MTTDTIPAIQFCVYGRPQQRGSKTPWLPRRKDGSLVVKNGRPVIATMDSNKKSKDWMAQVRQSAGQAFNGDLLRGPIRFAVTFYFSRPKSHFGSGKNSILLKPSAPTRHTQTPDCDKLVRCLADALTGVVLADDNQICELVARKEWTTEQERAEVSIAVVD
jgi:Holliday junction resolvase RusA-like endonuclease